MHFYNKNRNNVRIIAASSSIFTLAIIFASSTTIFMTAVVATTTASNNTTTTQSSGLELSPQPIWDEQVTTTDRTPINETHSIVSFIGNGTMTVPDTGETINMTNNGTGLVSPVPGYTDTVSAYGRERIFSSEDDDDTSAITFYEITRYDPTTFEGRGIIIAVFDRNATGMLAPFNGMMVVGTHEENPNVQAATIRLWEWETGIPLPSTSITDDELLPMNTTATATNATDTPAGSNATAAYTERAKVAAEETGILTKVTDQNAAAVLAEAAARERQFAAAETVVDAMIGLDAESRLSLQTNTQIVSGVQQQSQAFDENAVRIAAQASGLQTWRDGELAQAYFNIVETATALGFQGEATKANVVAMLEYIGTQERQNQLNEESVDTYFQLTDAQKEELRVLGITDEVMGQVALGVHDLSAEQAGAISTMGELNDTSEEDEVVL